jgi:hypothetical protein
MIVRFIRIRYTTLCSEHFQLTIFLSALSFEKSLNRSGEHQASYSFPRGKTAGAWR